MGDLNQKMYLELGSLIRYIGSTMHKLRRVDLPLNATTQLPQASEHLSDLTRLTEEGTHRVMGLTEEIQDSHVRMKTALQRLAAGDGSGRHDGHQAVCRDLLERLAADDKRLVDIMTALSFQDLVGQRIKKILAILEDVQHRLLEMVVVFGPKAAPAGAGEEDRTEEMLRQLEASRSTALKQDLVDDILEQCLPSRQ